MIINEPRPGFLGKIALHLTGRCGYSVTGSGWICFGDGTWRGRQRPWSNVSIPNKIGVELINANVSSEEIAVVERALAIIGCGEYQKKL